MYTLRYAAMSALLIVCAIGCSHGNNPVVPNQIETGELVSVPIGISKTGDYFNAIGLLGAYEVIVDPNKLNVEVVPKRVGSVGESYLVSGFSFFDITPCNNCFTLNGVDWSWFWDYIILYFDVTHPFKPGNTSLPPSATNRLDLDVFDLQVVIRPKNATPKSFPKMNQKIYARPFIPWCGFTTELNGNVIPGETAALPYFMVVDDTRDNDPPVITNNRFRMGAKKTVDIWMYPWDTSPPYSFDVYLTMAYGSSAKKPQRLTPKYYVPEFNRKAAWKVDAYPPHKYDWPDMTNTWNSRDSTTKWNVEVEVYDWQYGATISSAPDYSTADPSHIYAASNVKSISVEVLGMTNAPVTVNNPTLISGNGKPGNPLVYKIPVANEKLLPPGDYPALVKVVDSRTPGRWDVDGRDFLIHSPDGINLQNFNLPEFATYSYIYYCKVVNGCGPITGSILSPSCPVTNLGNGAFLNFTVSASSANGGNPITLYEVDLDFNGITFTTDFSNTTGIFNNLGPFINPNCGGSNQPYTFRVTFRAKDSCIPSNTEIFATCYVTVNLCCNQDELFYSFDGCTSIAYTCQGWSSYNRATGTGGCLLKNSDVDLWGEFKWGCNYGTPSGCSQIIFPYLSTGGDWPNCSYPDDHGALAEYDVASPAINLPTSSNSKIEFDHFNHMPTMGYFGLFISFNGCSGPWTQIWSTTIRDGCFQNTTVSLSSYSGSNVRFAFSYQSNNGLIDPGCINAGVMLDNIRIYGCFDGDLYAY